MDTHRTAPPSSSGSEAVAASLQVEGGRVGARRGARAARAPEIPCDAVGKRRARSGPTIMEMVGRNTVPVLDSRLNQRWLTLSIVLVWSPI